MQLSKLKFTNTSNLDSGFTNAYCTYMLLVHLVKVTVFAKTLKLTCVCGRQLNKNGQGFYCNI